MIFRHRVKEYRLNKKWSQKQLAQYVNVSRQTIISIESYRYNPSLELGMKLAFVLEVPIDQLFYFDFV
jgi:putative transcriptional regulator